MSRTSRQILDEARADAERRDRDDPLAPFRDRFFMADPHLIYLDGHSLGRLPLATRERLHKAIDVEWGTNLIRSWNTGWWEASRRVGDKVGQLLGARPGETVIADATSVNLYKLVAAFLEVLDPARPVLVDDANFPTDLYIAASAARRACPPRELVWLRADAVPPATLEDQIVAAFQAPRAPSLAVLSHVAFTSGERLDLARLESIAAKRDIVIVWDFSHSVGVVPIEVSAIGVAAAVGCTYKYLHGGPGAPAFLYLRTDWIRRLRNPIAGWFSHRQPFAMRADYEANPGIERFLTGTPPILSLLAIEPAVELVLEAGVERIWKKAVGQFDFFVGLAEACLRRFGISVATPTTSPTSHGAHVALEHPEAFRITQAWIAAGVIPDFRPPQILRVGLSPLSLRYGELVTAVQRLVAILETETWRAFPASSPDPVT